MRKLIYAINLTLDGCCDHTKGSGSDEILNHYTQLVREIDTFVYGRITYQLMVPFWPDVAKANSASKPMTDYAHAFNSVRQMVVVSKSLDKAEGNAKIIRANLREEILRLKQEQGRDMLVGGVDIPSQLMQLGLIDEYRFVIHPVIVGEGRRLMEGVNLAEKLQLKLVESKIFESGGVALRYVKG